MGKLGSARGIARTAMYGGSGLGALGLALYSVLAGEAKLARLRVGELDDVPPSGDGVWGHGERNPIRLALLGDSTAVGLGVTSAGETPGVLIASGLSEIASRPVRLITAASTGATSADLAGQVDSIEMHDPDIALILIGANDVIRRVRKQTAARELFCAVRRLRERGCEVVVGTCPDLGTVQPISQPLRLIVRLMSRELAAAQTVAVVEAGGRTVSFGDVLGPEFAARPSELFSHDRFHPSAAGYAAAAGVLLPSVCVSLGLGPQEDLPPSPLRREGVSPINEAAVSAAGTAGSEVAATRVEGRERGPWGRWAFLRRRRPRPLPTPIESSPPTEPLSTTSTEPGNG